MPDRVLITGATGFVGRHCLPGLRVAGYEVHALSSRPVEDQSGVFWHRADLFDASATAGILSLIKPTHLLHLAWIATPGKYLTSPENIAWVSASLELVRSFVENGGRRAVIAGTCLEYEAGKAPCQEGRTRLAPKSIYAMCKHCLRVMFESYAEQFGLSAAWARLFFLYGPYEPSARLVPAVIQALLRGEPARCTSGEQERDFLFVEDAAEALVALLTSDVQGAVNIASGKSIAIKGIVHSIGKKLRRGDLIRLGALPTAPEDPPRIVAATRRLNVEVGWKPHHDLDTGLDRTIAWWTERSNAIGRLGQ